MIWSVANSILETDFLTGSYKRATKTKKLKDVDIFCVIRTDGRDGDKRSLSPQEMLLVLQGILQIEYETVRIGRRSCTVVFGEDDDEAEDIMSFDVVPAFARAAGGTRSLTRPRTHGWRPTQPCTSKRRRRRTPRVTENGSPS